MNWKLVHAMIGWLILAAVVAGFIVGIFGIPEALQPVRCREGYVDAKGWSGGRICVQGYHPQGL